MNDAGEIEAAQARLAASREAALLRIARGLALELAPQRGDLERLTPDAALDDAWGFDSLTRAELLLRVEREFAVHLPEHLLGEAETLRDIAAALPLGAAPTPVATAAAPPPRAEVAEGHPAPDALATLTAVLDWHAANQGPRTHLLLRGAKGEETPLTYEDLAEAARRLARGLVAKGLTPGDRVALMLPTSRDFFVAFFGTLYAGGVPTPIYPPARRSQLEEHLRRQTLILRNAGAVLLITAPEIHRPARLLGWQVETLRGVETVDGLAGAAEGGDWVLPAVDAPALALLQYTSGSTGDPKGVMLSHANLLANIRAMGAAMGATPRDVFVSWLPLYHDMGLIGAWLGSLYYAALLVIMSPLTFLARPERWLEAIHQHRGTLSAAPNFAFELCLKRIEDVVLERLELGSLRMVANGAEPVSAETLRRFIARFARAGFRAEAMAPVYGLAENSVGLAFPPLGRAPVIDRVDRAALARAARAVPAAAADPHALEFVACGRPLPGHQIRVVDRTGELGERQEGRLQFRGPSATAGYFGNPAKTAALFDRAWLESGDLAYIAGGDVFITGRSKDIVIRAGRHIYPQELEDAIGEVPGIRAGCVAVFGSPDPRTRSERLVVLAETRETAPADLAELRRRAAEAASLLIDGPPDDIMLVPPGSVPKTSSGKLRRSAARALYETGHAGGRARRPALQLLRLGAGALAAQARRLLNLVRAQLYAAWWWTLLVLVAAPTWVAVVLLPRRARSRMLGGAARFFLRAVGIAPRLEQEQAWPDRAVIVANHASYLDGVVLAAALPEAPVFMAKRELAEQLVAGPFLRALGAVFVERVAPERGVEDTRAAAAASRSARFLVAFPEGTFTRVPGLRGFRMGPFVIAAEAGLPVLPVTLRGTRSVLRADGWFPRRAPLTVHCGAAIPPRGADFAAAVALREAARAAILRQAGEPDLAAERASPPLS